MKQTWHLMGECLCVSIFYWYYIIILVIILIPIIIIIYISFPSPFLPHHPTCHPLLLTPPRGGGSHLKNIQSSTTCLHMSSNQGQARKRKSSDRLCLECWHLRWISSFPTLTGRHLHFSIKSQSSSPESNFLPADSGVILLPILPCNLWLGFHFSSPTSFNIHMCMC